MLVVVVTVGTLVIVVVGAAGVGCAGGMGVVCVALNFVESLAVLNFIESLAVLNFIESLVLSVLGGVGSGFLGGCIKSLSAPIISYVPLYWTIRQITIMIAIAYPISLSIYF